MEGALEADGCPLDVYIELIRTLRNLCINASFSSALMSRYCPKSDHFFLESITQPLLINPLVKYIFLPVVEKKCN